MPAHPFYWRLAPLCLRRALAFLQLALLTGMASAAPQAGKLAPQALERFRTNREATVCICLQDEAASRSASSSAGLPREVRLQAIQRAQDVFLQSLGDPGYRVRYRYRFSPTILVDITDEALLRGLDAHPGVARAELDLEGSGGLAQSRRLIRADEVHARGRTGAGRVVAVLDTGIDSDHPDLQDAILHQYHFLKQGTDVGPGAEDSHGHGTNVAGILVSRGRVTGEGIAPGAGIVAIRVLDASNRGFISDWAAAVEHVVALNEASDGIAIDAINMSLVSDTTYETACDGALAAFSAACRAAREAGIAVFAASGNTGSPTRMASPACFSSVISVGSVKDTTGALSSFTSRNTLLSLLAPGESITSAGLGGGSSTFQGTSQACPQAAASACLLREANPRLTPADIEGVLKDTGVPVDDPAVGSLFPRIDLLAAILLVETPDCNQNGMGDGLDVRITRVSRDCDGNGLPDECDVLTAGRDLDQDGVLDDCQRLGLFLRGDVNASGRVDIADATRLLDILFRSGGSAPCADAMDCDDDGRVNISDAVFTLLYLFTGGSPLPPPGVLECGLDPTEDDLRCAESSSCL